jgi:hypothetical protein
MRDPDKTYKREVAIAMFTFLGGMFVWGVYRTEAMQAAQFLTLPVFTFGGAAFALDAVFKQGASK